MASSLEKFSRLIKIRCYRDVRDALSLKSSVPEDSRVVIVDLKQICDHVHLYTGGVKALLNESYSKMKTKTIASEVLYQLSSSTNINEGLKYVNVSEETQHIAVIAVGDDQATLELHNSVCSNVQGTEFDVDQLGSSEFLTADKTASVVKFFKLSSQELLISSLSDAVLSRLATKDYL